MSVYRPDSLPGTPQRQKWRRASEGCDESAEKLVVTTVLVTFVNLDITFPPVYNFLEKAYRKKCLTTKMEKKTFSITYQNYKLLRPFYAQILEQLLD